MSAAATASYEPFLEDPRRSAVLVDFDGSLAPIVARPEDARPLDGAAAVMERLAERLGRVAVVSGRAVAFLAEHLPAVGVCYAGLYGLEVDEDGERRLDPRVEPWLPVIEAAATEAERRLPGVLVERKAGVSVTLHWRTTPDREREVRAAAADLAVAHGLVAPQRGKAALELRPPVPVDKGTAVRGLLADIEVAAFAGDDMGDLPAFDALDDLCERRELRHCLRIGIASTDAPREVLDRVDLVLDAPEDLLAWLRGLADALDGR